MWQVGQQVVVWPSYRMNEPKLRIITKVTKTYVVTDEGNKWRLSGGLYAAEAESRRLMKELEKAQRREQVAREAYLSSQSYAERCERDVNHRLEDVL